MTKFIKTKDVELAMKLRQAGMQCVGESDGMYTFINDGKLPMMFADNTHLIFTDILTF